MALNSNDELYKSLEQTVDKLTKPPEEIRGRLGYNFNGIYSVPVQDNALKYYVRIERVGIEAAFHDGNIIPKADLAVILIKEKDGYHIKGPDNALALQNLGNDAGLVNVGLHEHRRFSTMPYEIDTRLLLQLAVRPKTGMVVTARAGFYRYNETSYWWSATDIDLSDYVPSTIDYHRIVVIGINTNTSPHSLQIVASDPQLLTVKIALSDIPVENLPGIHLDAVHLRNGQTGYAEQDFISVATLHQHTDNTSPTTIAGSIVIPSGRSSILHGDLDATAGELSVFGDLLLIDSVTKAINPVLFQDGTRIPELLDAIQLNPTPSNIPDIEAIVSWNHNVRALNIHSGLGPVLQPGQENWIIIYNDSAVQIDNFTVMRPFAVFDLGGFLYPTFELALADSPTLAEGTLVIATMDIPPFSIGLVSRFGRLHEVNTSALSPGATAYLSATVAGEITNVRPEFPDFNISLGAAFVSDVSDGIFFMSVTRDIFDIALNSLNGTFSEAFNFLITSDGAIVTGSLSPSDGHPNLTAFFSDVGLFVLDTDPPITIELTPGTDEVPVTNYIYIPIDTKVLAITTGEFPNDIEIIHIAQVLLQSAATTQLSGGAWRNQNWNDELADTNTHQGHKTHVSKWIRAQPASYVKDTGTDSNLAGTPTDVYIVSSPGDILQLHSTTMPAQDMRQYAIDAVSIGAKTFTISDDGDLTTTFYIGKKMRVNNSTGNDGTYTVLSVNYSAPDFVITVSEAIPSAVADGTIGDIIKVINDPDVTLFEVTNLNYLTKYSDGSNISNNDWFSIVTISIRNKAGTPSFLGCNVPSDGYNSESGAIADASNYSNYTIPGNLNGVAILTSRFTVRKTVSGFTYNGGDAYQDLRGDFPSTAPGGGGGGGGGASPLTTKGDLFGYSTLDARIPVGTDGQALKSDSAQALGVAWGDIGSLEFIEEKVLSAATSTTFSTGITGTDRYLLMYELDNAVGTNATISIRINGDSDSTDYASQNLIATGSTVSGTLEVNFSTFSHIFANQYTIGSFGFGMVSNGAGAYKMIGGSNNSRYAAVDDIKMQFRSVIKNTNISDITQIEILSDQANSMNGSIKLYRILS